MRTPRIQLTSVSIAAALALAACSSDRDTVLALTINSNQADVGGPANLRITVTPTSGAPVVDTFAPMLVDGSIVTSFFRRVTLNGMSGTVSVRVEALDPAGSAYLSATTSADLVENGAVAASIQLTAPDPDAGAPPPDGGTDADEDAGG